MFRKNYFTFLLAIALFLVGGAATMFAQTAPVRGQVVMKKADGTTEPVAGAVVEVYRTDVKAKLPSSKTDKKGYFNFAGLPLGADFAFSISAEKIKPEIIPNIKAGRDNLVINVVEGDGKKWTEDEVRQALATPATAASATGTSNQTSKEMTADQKKAQEEYQKQVAAVTDKNKKIEQSTGVIKRTLEEGSKAYESKNYDLAITKFDEGIAADPEFVGTAPVLLNNKALALVARATNNYNQSVKADAATRATAMESVKKDFENSIASSDKALTILKTGTSTDAAVQKNYDANKMFALANRKEAYRLMTKTGADRTKGKDALTAFQEYLAVETDAAKKSAAQLALGETLLDSQEFDLAIVEFEKVLASDPNNVEALAGAGFSLVNVGYISNDKSKFQNGANYLQKFADLAPDTHRFKDDAKGLIETLKKEQNVAPQKSAKSATRKKS
jgi:tetratricopeptide (TPR) repeat protein